MKIKKYYPHLIVLIALSVIFYLIIQIDFGMSGKNDNITSTVYFEEVTYYEVYVCGEVKRSGIYEVIPGFNIMQSILLAGGYTIDADETYYNPLEKVTNGQKIDIPKKMGVTSNLETKQIFDESSKVNINTATLSELKSIDGIGDKRAQSILDYRNTIGQFKTIEDLKKISYFASETNFNKYKHFFTI